MDLANILLLNINFLVYFYICYKLSSCKFKINKRKFVFITAISIAYYYMMKVSTVNNYRVILTFIILIIISKKLLDKDVLTSVKLSLIALIIMIISELLQLILFSIFFKISLVELNSNLGANVIYNMLTYITAISITNGKEKVCSFKDRIKINNFFIESFFLIGISFVLIINYSIMIKFKHIGNKVIVIIQLSFTILYFIIILIFLYTRSLNNKNKKLISIKEREYSQLKLYTNITEELMNDITKFKHDYNNMTYMVNGYLKDKDYNSIEEIFSKKILSEDQLYEIPKFKNIKDAGIKGLLTAKILEMKKSNINLYVEVIDSIYIEYIDTLDLCRILGVLLDNAYEAAKESEEKFVSISFLYDDELNIIVMNSFSGEINLDKIYKERYSTKGDTRGLGLSNVSSILQEKYPNIFLNTHVENEVFIQELYINSKDRKQSKNNIL